MSSSTSKLNQSFDDWYGAKSIVEEELKVIAKAVEKIRFSSHLRDAFTGHLLDVHRQWCGACPPAPAEAGHSVGGPEKDVASSTRTCTVHSHTQAGHAHAVAAYTPMEKTSVRYVSTCTQTTDLTSSQMDSHGAGNESSGSSGPSLMSSHLEAEESQGDVNRTTENPSTENLKDISTDFIKVEAPEDEAFQDVPVPVLLRLEEDHHDFDVNGGREDTPSWQRIEEELPSQLIESDEQSCLERRVSDQPIKDERDCEELQDIHVDMPGCSSDVMSHQEHVAEMQLATSVHPIKPEMDSQTHADLDVAGSSRGAVFHQGIMEELPPDRPDESDNSLLDCEVPIPIGISADQCSDVDSVRNAKRASLTDVNDMRFQSSGNSKKYSFMDDNRHLGTHPCQISSHSTNRSDVKFHSKTQTLEQSYKCDYCSYRCATMEHLEMHMRVHTGGKPLDCSLCGKRFKNLSHLKSHVRIHSGERPYRCSICGSRFSQKGHLKRHMDGHTGERPHECSLCGKRFKQLCNLKIHVRVHSGEKPFRCNVCSSRFTQKAHLTRHLMKHSGEKPHECSICGKRFKLLYDLKNHLARVHSSNKSYSCDICDYRCSDKGLLILHMSIHTGVEAT